MADLQHRYGIPASLMQFVDSGFLEIVAEDEARKTVELHAPSLRSTDAKGRITSYSLMWIHPDFNTQFCHFYDQKPGDLPNFHVTVDTTEQGDELLDLNSLDELLGWLADKSR